MLRSIVFYFMIVTSLIYMVHLGLYIVGANIYDVKQMIIKSRYRRPHRRTPLLSVIVPAHNEQYGIAKTLDSIMASSYKNIEIIVVDDGSTDKTIDVVRNYLRSSPKFKQGSFSVRWDRLNQLQLRLIKAQLGDVKITVISQKNAGKAGAVNNGIRNYAKGELIMTLDADSAISKEAIANTVRYFADPRVIGVAANVRVMDSGTALGALQKIEHMIGYRSKKFYTLTNCEFIVGGVASTYRMETLKEVGFYDTDTQTEDIGLSMKIVAYKGNHNHRIVYASDVLAFTEGVQTYKALFKQRYRWKMGMLQNLIKNLSLFGNNDVKYSRMLTMYRIPMAYLGEIILVIEPFLLIYMLYLSFINLNPFILIGAYGTITLYVLWTLLPDEYMDGREKFKYSLISPFMYFIFYVMNAVQIVAVIRCVFNHKTVLGRVATDSVWESPERAVQIVPKPLG